MASEKRDIDEKEVIETALLFGVVGAALGAALTGKSQSSVIAGLLGAAIGASFSANQRALKNNLSVLVEEDGFLYRIDPNGSRTRIKRLKTTSTKIPSKFIIE